MLGLSSPDPAGLVVYLTTSMYVCIYSCIFRIIEIIDLCILSINIINILIFKYSNHL